MNKNQKNYRQIFKATSLFGGVQALIIIIAVVRSKFIAVLLGPAGMGIAGLLTTTTGLIASITNLGLSTSAVKTIAEVCANGDRFKLASIVKVFRRLIWVTGLMGALITIIIAPWLSEITFGNRNYTAAFLILSVTLCLNQISSGQLVLLQGMRRLNLMARAILLGSLLGLFVAVPIYYLCGIEGIVPAIFLTSCVTLAVSFYFSRKLEIEAVEIKTKTIISQGKEMVVMGFFIGLTGMMDQLIAYITRIFISNYGDLDAVGLYNAGFAIVNTYVGMIFTAMMTDYYPRLSSVAKDNEKAKSEINQQAEIAVLILAPLSIIFLVFIKYFVILLYSEKFISIDKMIYWAMLGVLFKAVNWSVGMILLAKAVGKLYFLLYILSAIIVTSTNLFGYYYYGLQGLGMAFLAAHLLLTIQGYVVARIIYSFKFSSELIKIISFQFILCVLCFINIHVNDSPMNYSVGIILIIISSLFSIRELDKRIGIKNILKNLTEKLIKQ